MVHISQVLTGNMPTTMEQPFAGSAVKTKRKALYIRKAGMTSAHAFTIGGMHQTEANETDAWIKKFEAAGYETLVLNVKDDAVTVPKWLDGETKQPPKPPVEPHAYIKRDDGDACKICGELQDSSVHPADFTAWMNSVREELEKIGMGVDDWQAVFPYDYKSQFRTGMGAGEVAVLANKFYWYKQNQVLKQDCKKSKSCWLPNRHQDKCEPVR